MNISATFIGELNGSGSHPESCISIPGDRTGIKPAESTGRAEHSGLVSIAPAILAEFPACSLFLVRVDDGDAPYVIEFSRGELEKNLPLFDECPF